MGALVLAACRLDERELTPSSMAAEMGGWDALGGAGGSSGSAIPGRTGGSWGTGGNEDPGDVDCSTFVACGGDLTGTWNISSLCEDLSEDPMQTACASGWISYDFTANGTYTFGADRTFSTSGTIDPSATIFWPASCLAGYTSCDSLAASMEASGTSGQSVTCTGSTSLSCLCDMTMPAQPLNGSGTYTVSGSTLTLSTGDGSMSFCVQGKVLKMQSANSAGTLTMGATKR
jgi:hypothetical protein